MDKTIFFTPDILSNVELPVEEALHCIKVLRKKEGDEILLTDGKGFFYDAEIMQANPKHCIVNILKTIEQPKGWDFNLQIAFADKKYRPYRMVCRKGHGNRDRPPQPYSLPTFRTEGDKDSTDRKNTYFSNETIPKSLIASIG